MRTSDTWWLERTCTEYEDLILEMIKKVFVMIPSSYETAVTCTNVGHRSLWCNGCCCFSCMALLCYRIHQVCIRMIQMMKVWLPFDSGRMEFASSTRTGTNNTLNSMPHLPVSLPVTKSRKGDRGKMMPGGQRLEEKRFLHRTTSYSGVWIGLGKTFGESGIWGIDRMEKSI